MFMMFLFILFIATYFGLSDDQGSQCLTRGTMFHTFPVILAETILYVVNVDETEISRVENYFAQWRE
jgi:hypothetical protein